MDDSVRLRETLTMEANPSGGCTDNGRHENLKTSREDSNGNIRNRSSNTPVVSDSAKQAGGDNSKSLGQQNGVIVKEVTYQREGDAFPFKVRLHFSVLRRIQIALFAVFVMPIRIVFTCAFLGLAVLIAVVAVMGRPIRSDLPLMSWRLVLKKVCVFFVRCAWFSAGVHWVTQKGQRASSSEAPIIILSPHTSFVDTLAGAALGFPGVVSSLDNLKIPFVGQLFRINESIFVDRLDPDSRRKSAEEIRSRASNKGLWPQLAIFPEGTCANRTALPPYKMGAFAPGVPVQPCLVRYRGVHPDIVNWVNTGPGLLAVFAMVNCTPHTSMELEFLPVYYPSEEEKKDPSLYTRNVRQLNAKHLGIPLSSHNYADLKRMHSGTKPDRSITGMFKRILMDGEIIMPTHDQMIEVLEEK